MPLESPCAGARSSAPTSSRATATAASAMGHQVDVVSLFFTSTVQLSCSESATLFARSPRDSSLKNMCAVAARRSRVATRRDHALHWPTQLVVQAVEPLPPCAAAVSGGARPLCEPRRGAVATDPCACHVYQAVPLVRRPFVQRRAAAGAGRPARVRQHGGRGPGRWHQRSHLRRHAGGQDLRPAWPWPGRGRAVPPPRRRDQARPHLHGCLPGHDHRPQ